MKLNIVAVIGKTYMSRLVPRKNKMAPVTIYSKLYIPNTMYKQIYYSNNSIGIPIRTDKN